MTHRHQERKALKQSIAKVSQLTQNVAANAGELEQLFAEQKDALRGSYQALAKQSSTETPTVDVGTTSPPALIVVEDDTDDFMLLKRALYKAGSTARVWWAHDANEAISIFEELERFPLAICVVLDVQLHGMDGFELLAELKKRRQVTNRVKCVFLTGMTNQKTQDRAYAEGADGFFVKPLNGGDLVEIARALQKLATE